MPEFDLMRSLFLYVTFCFTILPFFLKAQDQTNFTQFFINPYILNPSYAGIEGKNAFFLSYRKQWAGIEGSPSIVNFSYHAPINVGLNYGFNVTNDTRGIVKNTGLQLSFAYALIIDRHKFLRFGLSAGGSFNSIDFSGIDPGDPLLTDPAISGMLDKNFSLLGNAGLSLHLKLFHMGVSLPNIFSPAYVSEDAFTVSEVKPFQSILTHASYRFYFAKDKYVFEPYAVYRINEGLPSQFEFAGVLHMNHKLWIGGSFKQDFGISALGGIKVSELLAIGGSYTLKNSGINELNSPTYEIQLSYLAGKKKKNAEVYSFVSTVKEKERKTPYKSASQQIAERRKQEEQSKKKQQDELAKKKREEEEAKKKAAATAAAVVVAKKPDEVKTTPPVVVQPTQQPVKKHDGGPRLKSDAINLDIPSYDTAHHEEQARLNKLTEHAADPDELHGQDTGDHPNVERHEFVTRGGHQNELKLGDYVIAGVFKSDANAKTYANGLTKLGFTADYGYLTERNLWYVYVAHTSDINSARTERDKYRQMKIFKDSWLLTVQP